LSSSFNIIATARSGHTLTEIEKVIQEELDKLKGEAPSERELQRAVNQYEASFLRQLESIDAKADQFNNYLLFAGNPDYFNEDLARYKAVDTRDLQTTAQTYLRDDGRVILSIVPQGKKDLAAPKKESE
jgi:zinc protease